MKTLHERLEAIYILKVAVDFGMATIQPFDGLFYFEKLKLLHAQKEKDLQSSQSVPQQPSLN